MMIRALRRARPARTSYALALLLGVLIGAAPLPGGLATPARAAAGDIGYVGPSTAGDGSAATGEKPESKLWWNDGAWWAVLFHTGSQTHHIFRLDRSTEQWVDTGTVVDNRPKTRSDVLWDGTRLYVSSHVRASSSSGAASGNPARLYRFSYDAATETYSRDTGFPAQITNYSSETLTIDRDSTGVLWATWTQGSKVYVNNTTGGDVVWGTPFVLPVTAATGLSSDDISSVVTFGGTRAGVMWSNQVTSAIYFAEHVDGAPRDTWNVTRTAIQGPNTADDHINLKSLQADTSGRVFAVIKTGLDDAGAAASAPLIMLLARDPSTGEWSGYRVGRIKDCHTRPVLLLDSEHQTLYVFMTAPDSGCPYTGYPGTIFMKSSPMSSIAFPDGRGTPVIRDADSANMNNVTTTKQSVTSVTGMVVMASNDDTQRYWHADLQLGSS
ncbi:hypothetical protein [Micromonospora chersina]|uniref:hypothetical protein n=1 Tax=Micromonospora chersina TaxID=47854 RepID=UPI0037197BA1